MSLIAAMMLGLAPARAAAADWWLVSQPPGRSVSLFADMSSFQRNGDAVRLRVLRIDRTGHSLDRIDSFRCDAGGRDEGERVLRRFACASEQERASLGLILATISPETVAQIDQGR